MSSIASQLSFSRARNVVGGALGSIPYQDATSSTVFVPIGSNGFVLTSNGTTATWSAATGLGAGTANSVLVTATTTASSYFLTFVDSNNATAAYEAVYTDAGLVYNPSSDLLALTGNLTINGGSLQSSQTTFNLINTTATTVNFAGSATALTIGELTGFTAVRNQFTVTNTTAATSTITGALQVRGGVGIGGALVVGGAGSVGGDLSITGDLTVTGGDIFAGASTFNLINTTATTINFGGAGTNITIGAATGATSIQNNTTVTSITAATSTATGALVVRGGVGINGAVVAGGAGNIGGDLTVGGDLSVNGGDLYTNQTTFNLVNTTATTVNFGGAATALTIGATTGVTTIRNATTVSNSTNATSTATGALVVQGGVGINRDVYIGGNLNVTGTVSGTFSGNAATVSTLQRTTAATHFITFVDSDNASATAENVYTTSTLVVNPNTQFVGIGTGTPTATLTVGGGARISGLTTVTNSTNATSTATGALLVDGGVGVNRDVYIGGNQFLVGDLEVRGGDLFANVATTFNLINTTATTVNFAGAATSLTMGASANGSTTIRNDTTITSTTAASSTVTGSLQVRGGAGIGGNLYVGGTVHGTVNSATNLAGGTAMSIHYQSAANATAFLAAGSAGQILQTNGTGSAPTWVNASSVSAGTATLVTTVQQPVSATYFPVFVDSNNSSATAESLYTTSTFVINPNTQRVGIGTSTPAETLQVKGNAIIGNNDSNFGAILQLRGYANSFKNWQIDVGLTGGNFNITPSTTDGGTTFTTPALAIDTNSNIGFGVTAPTAKLHVVGGTRITGVTTVTNTTAATSTITGALQVAGGAGVGGDIYAGGDVYTRGIKLVPLNIQEFTATASQTTFTISGGYTVGTVQVFANGIQMGSGAFVASNGTTVVLNTARSAGDIIRVVSGGTSSQANNQQSYSIAMSVALGA